MYKNYTQKFELKAPLINIGCLAQVQAQAPSKHPNRLYQGQHQRSHPQTGEVNKVREMEWKNGNNQQIKNSIKKYKISR